MKKNDLMVIMGVSQLTRTGSPEAGKNGAGTSGPLSQHPQQRVTCFCLWLCVLVEVRLGGQQPKWFGLSEKAPDP